MNKVELSGTIVGELLTRTEPDGEPFTAVRLLFDRKSDPITVFCYAERAMTLANVTRGQQVRVSGRLMVHPKTRRAGILVDRLETDVAPDREAELWNATRRFQDHATVKDNRWATRARFVK
jgi:hypothetical protein